MPIGQSRDSLLKVVGFAQVKRLQSLDERRLRRSNFFTELDDNLGPFGIWI
jgi:hypothetical protein